MGIINRVEHGLAKAVHGAFAKAFKSEVQPVAPGSLHFFFEPGLEVAAVEQVRERIDGGGVSQHTRLVRQPVVQESERGRRGKRTRCREIRSVEGPIVRAVCH